jgi:hypothetical protein
VPGVAAHILKSDEGLIQRRQGWRRSLAEAVRGGGMVSSWVAPAAEPFFPPRDDGDRARGDLALL